MDDLNKNAEGCCPDPRKLYTRTVTYTNGHLYIFMSCMIDKFLVVLSPGPLRVIGTNAFEVHVQFNISFKV